MVWVALDSGLIVGILSELFSGALGVLVSSTALGTGTLRALAIPRKPSTEQVEWMTAVGFVGGAGFGALVLDLALG